MPQEILKELGLSIGSSVEVRIDRRRKVILIRPLKESKHEKIDPEFARDVQEFIRTYKSALDELAK